MWDFLIAYNQVMAVLDITLATLLFTGYVRERWRERNALIEGRVWAEKTIAGAGPGAVPVRYGETGVVFLAPSCRD